ncbi:hypothetical protein Cfor_02901, partial [Coptotermes formosanus]
FSFFNVIRFKNNQCDGTGGQKGICYSRKECASLGGIASGNCARNWGTCCVIQKTCGTTANLNCTYFVNAGFPGVFSGDGRCNIGVSKCNSGICQLRIDFLDFVLAQPNGEGYCTTDQFEITGSAYDVPNICGENSGQHVYVDFVDNNTPIQLSVRVGSTTGVSRRWNIRICQIGCDSSERAPAGALMYYRELRGTVKSFNYGSTVTAIGTRQIANLNYAVVVRPGIGYCSIQWSQQTGDPYSFTVSGDTDAVAVTDLGTSDIAENGAICTKDFIVIPNPQQNQIPLNTDRFCGNALIQTTFFPFFGLIRFKNVQCTGTNGQYGTCFSRQQCSNLAGISSGSCARNWGTCCVIQRTCGSSTNLNCTYFTNPGFPGMYTGSGQCNIMVSKCNSNICQLRIDFLAFTLSGPNPTGFCVNDYLAVTGGASLVPRICGENADEHVYVDFSADSTPIQLSIRINPAVSANRIWNIKLTQIECTNPQRAPTGCLMYYTGTEGTVKSFNYSPSVSAASPIGTRQIANTNYGVCVQMVAGYCSIEWTQNPSDPYSFTVSGNTGGVDPSLLGTAYVAESGAVCTTDFIVIPNPYQNSTSLNTDRFCGNALVQTTTFSKPFVLTVVTDNTELRPINADIANRGFCLNYEQLPC